MSIKQQLKRQIRRIYLQGLRMAARPALLYRPNRPNLSGPPKKLLVIRPDHLGDVLLTTPALTLLRRALPDTEITALIGPWGMASLQNNPDIDKIIRCNFPGFSREPNANFFAPYLYALQQSRELRNEGYDAVISFRFDHWWGALLAYLADIGVRVGYDWPESRPFLTAPLAFDPKQNNPKGNNSPRFATFGQPAQHSSALALSLAAFTLRLYGIDPEPFLLNEEDLKLKFYPSAEDARYVDLHLSEWGIGRDDRVVAVHPGTGATIKLWTAEGFAAVADTLAERYGAKVVLVGGPAEKTLLNNITKHCKVEHLRWETGNSWGRLAALFRRCNLVVGLDSGPLHLAVAVDAPSIHLFGPTDPTLFGPWGSHDRHRVVKTELDLPCCPCGVLDSNRTCWRGGYCMRTIKASQVLQAAEEMLLSSN